MQPSPPISTDLPFSFVIHFYSLLQKQSHAKQTYNISTVSALSGLSTIQLQCNVTQEWIKINLWVNSSHRKKLRAFGLAIKWTSQYWIQVKSWNGGNDYLEGNKMVFIPFPFSTASAAGAPGIGIEKWSEVKQGSSISFTNSKDRLWILYEMVMDCDCLLQNRKRML